MKINKICLGLSALLLVSALAGCGQEPIEEPTDTTRNTAPLISTTAPTATAPIEFTEPPEAEEPPVTLAPVTKLSATGWSILPQFVSLGEGRVLAFWNDYREDQGIVHCLDLLDVYKDQVFKRRETTGARELLEQSFTDGCFVLTDEENLYIYDRNLTLTKEFSAPNTEGYFSPDRANYYFVDNDVLYRMDVSSGSYGRMSLEYDLRLDSLIGVHPYWNIVVARYCRSFYDDSYGVCAINCNSGKLMILNENADYLWFDGDNFYAAMTSDQVYGVDIGIGTLSDGMAQKATASALGSGSVSYTMLSGSGILVLRTTADDNLTTTIYDFEQHGISSALAQYDYNTSTLSPVYLRQEQLIFGAYPQEDQYFPVVIDPKALSYEKSLSINKEIWPALVDRAAILQYQQEVQGPQLPESLNSLRLQADAMEEKYGVQILLENQTLELCLSYASVETDAGRIATALNTLDQALALYPDGFLKQFQNGIGEGGIYFCLTGRIQGSLNPVGKTLKNKNRYELLLDIGADDLDKTIHHELWHAIEMELSTDTFDSDSWNALNPKSAAYYEKYDSGYEVLTQWTFEKSGSNCCFVDAYARINSREDRARLMEYVMATDAEALLQSSVLRQKLQLMSTAIREYFDTAGWQTPYWEQYL